MDNYHVRKGARGWVLLKEGAERPAKVSGSKTELLKIVGRFLQDQSARVMIHKVDGSVAEERVYPQAAQWRTG